MSSLKSDLWGSAEVQLVISAGVWSSQLASCDAQQLKKTAIARGEFWLENSSTGGCIPQCFAPCLTCYHLQEEMTVLLEIQSAENIAREMCEHCPVFGLLSCFVPCKDKSV